MLQLDQRATLRRRLEQIAARADHRFRRGDDLLADGVDRRIGHLREQLLEIIVEQLRLVREHRQRRVRAHRAERLHAVVRHRADDEAQVLEGVAKRLLPLQNFAMIRLRCPPAARAGFQAERDARRATADTAGRWRSLLQFLVGNDAALLRVHEKHAARLQPALIATRSGAIGSTPASDAMMTRSSLVT